MTATVTVPLPAASPRDAYDGALSLAQARDAYFRANGFADDGGYSATWVDFKVGPVPFPFPNTKSRVRAVKYHDLHHIMTGYQTTLLGELEISAWELGAGCADMVAAWVLNLGGLAAGMLLAPTRTTRAFARGRRSRTLYRHTFDDALLARTVDDVRAEIGLERDPAGATLGDLAVLGAYWVSGAAVGVVTFAVLLPLAPFGWLAGRVFRG